MTELVKESGFKVLPLVRMKLTGKTEPWKEVIVQGPHASRCIGVLECTGFELFGETVRYNHNLFITFFGDGWANSISTATMWTGSPTRNLWSLPCCLFGRPRQRAQSVHCWHQVVTSFFMPGQKYDCRISCRNFVCLSVCLSICPSVTRVMHCEYTNTVQNGNHFSCLTPTVAGGRCHLPSKFSLKVTHLIRKTPISTGFCL